MKKPQKITICRNGKPDSKLWDNGWSCWLILKMFGFYFIGYSLINQSTPKGR
jgi:hypothetical protein